MNNSITGECGLPRMVLNVTDVGNLTGKKPAYCYKLIKKLNTELEEKGYMSIPGSVPSWYFVERTGIKLPSENDPQTVS